MERKALPKEAEEDAFQKGSLRNPESEASRRDRALKALNRVGQATFAADVAHKGKSTFEVLNRKNKATGKPKAEKVVEEVKG